MPSPTCQTRLRAEMNVPRFLVDNQLPIQSNEWPRVIEFVEYRGERIEVNEFLRRAESARGDERHELRYALFNWNPFPEIKPVPCPKCGPLNDVLFANDEWHGTYCYCPHCGRRGPDGNKSRDEAVAAWNRRAGEERK